ncbi:MAG: family 43 glycosylhydrolase [Planctomycetota bacterium]|nr:family 43 glycosylhydrolase [Planctomycetota bacterium]
MDCSGLYKTAVAVWHLAGFKDSAGKNDLTLVGAVSVGTKLTGGEYQESLRRGGDGFVAQFDGGYLDAGQGDGGALNLTGSAITVYVRLRSPSGVWGGPLFSKHDGHDRLVYNLLSNDAAIGFELGTQRTPTMTQVTVPLALIGRRDWHDIICRYDGAKLQMFADGVWLDEGFPMGPLREGNTAPCLIGAESIGGAVKSGWKGLMDHVAVWSRALSDEEIECLSGGTEQVAARRKQYVGELPCLQYYKPRDPFSIGDTLPLFHDGVFHFYHLLDRGHHSAKNGLGAHQWAHASSTDLVHWQQHPLAVPITKEEEGSICTGSVFFHGGTFHAFYATRIPGRGELLSLAVSTDGVRFAKTEPNPFLTPGPKYANGFRDPFVFRDSRTGLFHLIVSTTLRAGSRACLAQYVSRDLQTWDETEPFLVEEQKEVPECPDYFEWNGWHYLLFSYGQVARYRMSREPLGPWRTPPVEVLDGGAARVLKTAAFVNNRRIGTASIWPHGYAGWAVFRELVQNSDGTLGTAFVREMIPPCGEAVALQCKPLDAGAGGDGHAVRLTAADSSAAAQLSPLPRNARIRLRIECQAAGLTLNLRASDADARGNEICILPGEKGVSVSGATALSGVEGLDRPFTLDIVAKDEILDLCINQRRTLVNWVPNAAGDRLTLTVEKGSATCEQIEVAPLRCRP